MLKETRSNILSSKMLITQETGEKGIWSGYKKWLCFNTFTKYGLTTGRLFYCKGLICFREADIELRRITDISYSRSLIQMLFGRGDVTVTYDKGSTIVLRNIAHAWAVKEQIYAAYKADRAKWQRIDAAKMFSRAYLAQTM